MGFTIDFLFELGRLLLYILPLLIALTIAISGLALWTGKQEGWPLSDSLYYGFITATRSVMGIFIQHKVAASI